MGFSKENLIQARKNKRWTISDLSRETGISRKSISSWEKGIAEPKKDSLVKVCKALKVAIGTINDSFSDISYNIFPGVDFASAFNKAIDFSIAHDSIQKAFNSITKLNANLEIYSALLNTLNHTMNSGLYIKDVDNKYIYANEYSLNIIKQAHHLSILGYTDNDILPKDFAQVNYDEDFNVINQNIKIKNKKILIHLKSETKKVLMNKSPIINYNGKTVGMLCSVIDITEDNEVDKYKKIIRSIVQSINDGVWIAEHSELHNISKPVMINKYLANELGISPKKALKDRELFSNIFSIDSLDLKAIEKGFSREYETYSLKTNSKIKISEQIQIIDRFVIAICRTNYNNIDSFEFNK